jgi:hypothetical protein
MGALNVMESSPADFVAFIGETIATVASLRE